MKTTAHVDPALENSGYERVTTCTREVPRVINSTELRYWLTFAKDLSLLKCLVSLVSHHGHGQRLGMQS